MPSGNRRIRVTVYRGDERVTEARFDKEQVVVGSFTQADLVINDPELALRHFLLAVGPDGAVSVQNLTDEGRTKVSDRGLAANETLPLESGSAVQMGAYRVLVVRDDETAAAQLRASSGPRETGGRPALEVAMYWEDTLLKVEHYTRLTEISVGEKRGVQFFAPLAALDLDVYPLIVAHNEKFAVNLSNPGIKGQVLIRDKYYTVPDLRAAGLLVGKDLLVVEGDVRCRVEIDNVAFLVSHTMLPFKPKTAFFGRVNFQEHIYTSISLIAHVLFLIILSLIPEEALVAQRDPHRARNPAFQVLAVAAEEKKEEEQREEEQEKKEIEDGDKPDPEADATETVEEVKPEVRQPDEITTKLSPQKLSEHNRQVARQTGITRVFDQQTDLIQDLMSAGSGTWGGSSRGLRTLVSHGAGGMEAGAYFTGGGGLDPFGGTLGGPGGGGFRGTAIAATMGGAGATETEIAGLGSGDLKGGGRVRFDKKVGRVSVTSGRAEVEGGLDQATIGRYIRRNIAQIRWCYRNELQKDHSLQGRVTVEFVIAPTGRVIQSSIAADTMGNQDVTQCILRTVNLWRFPSTTGGAMARVRYPFIFRPL